VSADQNRTERLEARIPPELKELLMRASSLERKSMTDYMVECLYQATRATIQSHNAWELSQAESVAFIQAILTPEPPNPKLQAAADKPPERPAPARPDLSRAHLPSAKT
jgi:uncharacterized protein (DUF1778 family)